MTKKIIPVALAVLLLSMLVFLLSTSKKTFNHRITLSHKDKIPYGTYVAYNSLKNIFPEATTSVNKTYPAVQGNKVVWRGEKQVIIIVTKKFDVTDYELDDMLEWAENGNDILVSAFEWNKLVEESFKINLESNIPDFVYQMAIPAFDTLALSLTNPPFAAQSKYRYPGKNYYAPISTYNADISYAIGTAQHKDNILLKFPIGKGNIYLHTSPMAFSNYFLLYNENIRYWEQLISLIQPNPTTIVWDEYYLYKRDFDSDDTPPSPFRILMQQPGLNWAIYTAIAALLLFVLLGFKRQQRIIPEIRPISNDALDFVKTIGRLYYQHKDNNDITHKMILHFSDFVTNRFNLSVKTMDEAFITSLAMKTGIHKDEISKLVTEISTTKMEYSVSDAQVTQLYFLLDKFYKSV